MPATTCSFTQLNSTLVCNNLRLSLCVVCRTKKNALLWGEVLPKRTDDRFALWTNEVCCSHSFIALQLSIKQIWREFTKIQKENVSCSVIDWLTWITKLCCAVTWIWLILRVLLAPSHYCHAIIKRGLSHRAVFMCLSVCLSRLHILSKHHIFTFSHRRAAKLFCTVFQKTHVTTFLNISWTRTVCFQRFLAHVHVLLKSIGRRQYFSFPPHLLSAATLP